MEKFKIKIMNAVIQKNKKLKAKNIKIIKNVNTYM